MLLDRDRDQSFHQRRIRSKSHSFNISDMKRFVVALVAEHSIGYHELAISNDEAFLQLPVVLLGNSCGLVKQTILLIEMISILQIQEVLESAFRHI